MPYTEFSKPSDTLRCPSNDKSTDPIYPKLDKQDYQNGTMRHRHEIQPPSYSQRDEVPHARMINGKFDLSPYCKSDLIDSVTKITSIQFALLTIFKPAARIVWRSLWYDEHLSNLRAIANALMSNQPITDVQFRRKTTQTQQQIQSGNISMRTVVRRVAQFAFVGIPLACMVGLAFGILNWFQSLFNLVLQFLTHCFNIYRNVNEDYVYYNQHPEELPERKLAIDSVTNQVVAPYVSKIIATKVPIVGPRIAPRIQEFLGKKASYRINQAYDVIESKMQNKQVRHVS